MFTEKQMNRLLDTANTGCQHGHIYDARAIYKAVLELKHNFIPARIGLAFSHITLDEFDIAKELLTSILEKNPDDKDAKAILGLCYLLAKETEKAHEILKPLAEDTESPAGRLAISLMNIES